MPKESHANLRYASTCSGQCLTSENSISPNDDPSICLWTTPLISNRPGNRGIHTTLWRCSGTSWYVWPRLHTIACPSPGRLGWRFKPNQPCRRLFWPCCHERMAGVASRWDMFELAVGAAMVQVKMSHKTIGASTCWVTARTSVCHKSSL